MLALHGVAHDKTKSFQGGRDAGRLQITQPAYNSVQHVEVGGLRERHVGQL